MKLRARSPLLLISISAALFSPLLGCSSGTDEPPPSQSDHFSFFVTSFKAMQEESGSQSGFGGDFRLGETGPGAGLRGADKLCARIAEKSMPGAGNKQWRAFLSAVSGEDGKQVNAMDRIGEGPWYDRLGRLVANNKAELLNNRPSNADMAIINDLPNEDGVPNHQPDPSQPEVDNHDILTGTNDEGMLYSPTATCLDWTSAVGELALDGRPRVGHSWPGGGLVIMDGGPPPPPPDGGGPLPPPDGGPPPPPPDGGGGMMGSGDNWMSSLDESGCAPGVNLVQNGPPDYTSNTVGSGGGYGGIYCFALTP